MKNTHLFLSLSCLITLLFLSGCGPASENDSENGSTGGSITESYSYDFDSNGCKTGKQTFSSKDGLCSGLKDNGRNNGCAIELRESEFKRQNCPGDFGRIRDNPDQPSPEPSRNPNPIPAPSPRPTREPLPAIGQELEAAGIEVSISDPQYRDPGQPPFQLRLEAFWEVVKNLKDEILSRKPHIKKLVLATLGTYYPDEDTLYLDVDLNQAHTLEYLKLQDRRWRLEFQTEIPMDFGVEVHSYSGTPLLDFENQIRFLEQSRTNLERLKYVVKKLSFDTYSVYWFGEHELKLDETRYADDFQKFVHTLAPLSQLFGTFQKKGGQIYGNYHIELSELPSFERVLEQLRLTQDSLKLLLELRIVRNLQLGENSSSNYYESTDKTLGIATESPGLGELKQVINTFAKISEQAITLEMSLDPGFDLNSEFFVCAERFLSYKNLMTQKKSKIQRVKFGYSSSYYEGELYIGHADSSADLEKVLREIRN